MCNFIAVYWFMSDLLMIRSITPVFIGKNPVHDLMWQILLYPNINLAELYAKDTPKT